MSRTAGARDKQKRARRVDADTPKGIIAAQNPELPENFNREQIGFMMEIIPKEPLDSNDVAEMERRFENYLRICAERDMRVSNQGAYLAIGISKDNVYDWTVRSSTNPERSDFIKKVQKICAFYRESMMASGKLNPVVGIFWQKNYDGFKDQQEVVLTPNTDPLGEQKDPESMRQKYLEATYNLAESAESAERAISDPPQLPERTRDEAPAQNP